MPAPTIVTLQAARLATLIWANSTAAELIDTAPVPMLVSERTRLPAVIASLNSLLRMSFIPLYCCPKLWVCLT